MLRTASRVAFARLAKVVTERPLPVVAGALALTSLLAVGAMRAPVVSDIDAVVPDSHPYTRIDADIRADFGGSFVVLAVVQPHSGTVWRPEVLEIVAALTDDVLALPGVIRPSVMSLASPFAREVRSDAETGLAVEYLMREVPHTPEAIDRLRSTVHAIPLYRDVLVSADERAAAVSADFTTIRDPLEIARRMREVVDRHATPDVDILLTGPPIILETLQAAVATVRLRFALAFFLIGLVLYASFRTVQAMVLPLLTALLSTVWGVGAAGWLGIGLDAFSASMPILIMAVAAGHSAQMLERFAAEVVAGLDERKAVAAALVGIGPVMVAAGCTAAAGFGSLAVFTIPSFRHSGLIAAFGILAAVCLELTFMPALRCLLPPTRLAAAPGPSVLGRGLDAAARWLSGPRRWWIFGGWVVVALLGAAALPRLAFEYRMTDLLPKGARGRVEFERIRDRFKSVYPVVVPFDAPNAVAEDPRMIAFVDGLQRELERDPAVVRTTSYVDVLRYARGVWEGRGGDAGSVLPPSDRQLAAQLLWLTYSEAYAPLLSRDFRRGAVWVFLASDDIAAFRRVIARAATFTERTPRPPEARVRVAGGIGALTVAFTDIVVMGKVINMATVMLAVFLMSALVLQSFVGGALVVLPLCMTVLIEFALMAVLGISLNPSTATISAMAVGIGADYAIYLLYRLRDEYARCGLVEPALRETLGTSGRAVIIVAFAISAGYASLLLSDFAPFRITGLLVTITMMVSCLSALAMTGLAVALRPRFLFGVAAHGSP